MLWLTPVARLRRILRWVTGDPSSPLAGKRVMLTGASSGIGEATALAVAAKGGEVLLVATREAELRRVRRFRHRPAELFFAEAKLRRVCKGADGRPGGGQRGARPRGAPAHRGPVDRSPR